jgi:hypothetical protein
MVAVLEKRPYDPTKLVCEAGIPENYRLDANGKLDEDEAMRCVTCGFASRLPGAPVFAWVRLRSDVEPPVVELCGICNGAAGGRALG